MSNERPSIELFRELWAGIAKKLELSPGETERHMQLLNELLLRKDLEEHITDYHSV